MTRLERVFFRPTKVVMQGRKPTPTALKIIRGNPGKRPISTTEPKSTGKAQPPEWLGAHGRKHWEEIAPMLENIGVLTALDALALGDLCLAYEKWRLALEREVDEGAYTTAQSGFPVMSPWVIEGERQRGIWRKLQTEFGMTPSSRSRVSAVAPEEETNPFAIADKMKRSK